MQLDLLLNQMSVRLLYLWMLQMHSMPLTAKLHCTTSDAYAHPLLPYSSTHTEVSPSFSLMDIILSQEGTTQGDPLAMPIYGLATIPLIRTLDKLCKQVC